MKKIIFCLAMLTCMVSSNAQKIEFTPSFSSSLISKGWFDNLIEKNKDSVKISYDNSKFIVLSKKDTAMVIFNYSGSSYLIPKHKSLPAGHLYGDILNTSDDSPLPKIEKLFGVKAIVLDHKVLYDKKISFYEQKKSIL